MNRKPVVFVLSLGILVSSRGIAQSIGPDGRVLPAYSGDRPTVPAPTAAATTVGNAPVASPSAAMSNLG